MQFLESDLFFRMINDREPQKNYEDLSFFEWCIKLGDLVSATKVCRRELGRDLNLEEIVWIEKNMVLNSYLSDDLSDGINPICDFIKLFTQIVYAEEFFARHKKTKRLNF